MKTTIREENGKAIVTFEGRLDTAAAEQVSKDVESIYEGEARDIIIDCTELSYISSSGLRILLGIRKYAGRVGAKVSVVGANEDIRSILFTTGFNNLFEIV